MSVSVLNADSLYCRMKSRPEYHAAFSSPAVFYRALHIISTQRYRLPVRRYILDLFDIELNAEVVEALSNCATSLQAPESFKLPKAASPRRVSMFGHLGRPRRNSESDEDEDELGANEDKTIFVEERPAISLRPISRIVGFAT
jgi:large subunit ribosomal protein L17e